MTNVVQHDAANNCYRVTLEGDYQAVVKYQQQDNVLHITSTRVPDELQGKGYGKVMMEAVLPEIESLGYQIKPVCPYVIHYMEKNQTWSHLLA